MGARKRSRHNKAKHGTESLSNQTSVKQVAALPRLPALAALFPGGCLWHPPPCRSGHSTPALGKPTRLHPPVGNPKAWLPTGHTCTHLWATQRPGSQPATALAPLRLWSCGAGEGLLAAPGSISHLLQLFFVKEMLETGLQLQ